MEGERKMDRRQLAAQIDATLVQTGHPVTQIDEMIDAARQERFACCFALPCYFSYVKERLAGTGVHIGGVVGFPSGGETTQTKLFQAKETVALGAEEVDMVINVGYLLSGMDDQVTEEIRRVKEIVGERPLKCIIEASLLNDDQIKRASLCVVEAGADYVKTGTGWIAPTTIHQIQLIKSVVGENALIKAAGGIRDLKTAMDFLDAGAYRLGIGLKNAVKILQEIG